ncbi:MAG: hypothetical protein KUG77_29890 [Nannocystaceae bacterium]|nr:hypothetical protein [Nannocystaceae bacterium]
MLLLACVACACDDSDGTSETSGGSSSTGGDSTTGAGSTDTGIATTPPGSTDTGIATTPPGSTDTGIATTPPGSTDTGIATTPPDTDGSTSGTATTGDDGIAVQLSYSFTAEVAGVPLDCESAGASWVDVTVLDAADPDDKSFDILDLDCDDQVISIGPLPVGSYTVSVVAWDQSLWFGDGGQLELDGTDRLVELLVPLAEIPRP